MRAGTVTSRNAWIFLNKNTGGSSNKCNLDNISVGHFCGDYKYFKEGSLGFFVLPYKRDVGRTSERESVSERGYPRDLKPQAQPSAAAAKNHYDYNAD